MAGRHVLPIERAEMVRAIRRLPVCHLLTTDPSDTGTCGGRPRLVRRDERFHVLCRKCLAQTVPNPDWRRVCDEWRRSQWSMIA